jgi:hypothetical protein
MDMQPTKETEQNNQQENIPIDAFKTTVSCCAAVLIPGLGHALLKKWTRAVVFFFSISIMAMLGLQMHGQLFQPVPGDIFSYLKFIAEAGAGLFYWIPFILGFTTPDAKAYTYDYANLYLYVAGLLNMLVVIDVFDISLGRKK